MVNFIDVKGRAEMNKLWSFERLDLSSSLSKGVNNVGGAREGSQAVTRY